MERTSHNKHLIKSTDVATLFPYKIEYNKVVKVGINFSTDTKIIKDWSIE